MEEFINKGFNELFLAEMSKFDSRKYAYEIFFNADFERFSKISQFYFNENGSGAYNYMRNTYHSWKNNYVTPNGMSTYRIISSTCTTFTIDEKFVEAYTLLGNFIKNGFPKIIQLKQVNKTFEQIIEKINSFDLEKTSSYSKYIYSKVEIIEFQSYVKEVFKYYTKTIFENLNVDLELFKKVYTDINTAFLTTSFHTYLFNIEISIHNVVNKKFEIKKVFDLDHAISFKNLLSNKIAFFSIKQVSQISKANDTTKIDAILSENEIEKIVFRKVEIEKSNLGGTVDLNLKTNSGILKISFRILSPKEKLIITIRIIVFLIANILIANYFILKTNQLFIFVCGLFVSSFLILPILGDINKLTKDLFKTNKDGRK